MSDLISRQVLKDWIKSHNDVTFESSIEDMILQVVDDQPTAYDVEAVVRKLEAESTFFAHKAEYEKDLGYAYVATRKYGISDGLDLAIEIVRRGGRND